MAKKQEEIDYPKLILRLEEIVKELKRPDIKIEDSIQYYKEGKGLIEKCKLYLGEKSQEIEELSE